MKNINEYIEKYNQKIDNTRILNENDLRSIIDSKAAAMNQTSKNKLFPKIGGIMKSIIIIVTVGLVSTILFMVGGNPFTSEQKNQVPGNLNEVHLEKKIVEKDNIEDENDIENVSEEILTKNQIRIPLLHLSEEELAKVGIFKKDGYYEFITESQFYDDRDLLHKLKVEGYPDKIASGKLWKEAKIYREKNILFSSEFLSSVFTKFMDNEILHYSGWDINKSSKIFPVKYLDYGSFMYFPFYHKSSLGFRANASQEANNQTNGEIDNFIMNVVQGNMDPSEMDYFVFNKNKYPKMAMHIPLYISTDGSTHGFLWYLCTKEFVQLLPRRYKDYIDQYLEYYNELGQATITDETTKTHKRFSEILMEEHKIPELDLSLDELKSIGIEVTEDGFSYVTSKRLDKNDIPKEQRYSFYQSLKSKGYNLSQDNILLRQRSFISYQNPRQDTLNYDGWEHKEIEDLAPIAITINISGKKYNKKYEFMEEHHGSRYHSNSAKSLNNLKDSDNNWLSRIVPIRYILPVTSSHPKDRINLDCLIWYELTDQFLKKLPARYREQLMKEMDLLNGIETGALKPEEACKELDNEESILDVCSYNSKNINSINIYPNPAQDRATCEIEFSKSSNCRILLADMSGAIVKQVLLNKMMNKGTQKIDLNLTGLNNGIYLLIASSEGEEVVRKIIVQ